MSLIDGTSPYSGEIVENISDNFSEDSFALVPLNTEQLVFEIEFLQETLTRIPASPENMQTRYTIRENIGKMERAILEIASRKNKTEKVEEIGSDPIKPIKKRKQKKTEESLVAAV